MENSIFDYEICWFHGHGISKLVGRSASFQLSVRIFSRNRLRVKMKTLVLALLLGCAEFVQIRSVENFDFDGFNASSEVSFDNPALERCVGSPEAGSCALVRRNLGDVPIYGGIVNVKRRRVSDIQFTGSRNDFVRSVETLEAKLGSPDTRQFSENGQGGYIRLVEWKFSDGLLSLISDSADARYYASLINRANPDPITKPKVDF